MAVHFLRMLLYYAVLVLVRTVNWTHHWLVRARRRIHAAVVEAVQVARRAAAVAAGAALQTGRVVLLPLLILLGTAVLMAGWASQSLIYLVSGSPLALVRTAAAGGTAVVLLTLAWMLLSGLPVRTTLPSANRTLTISGANGLILLAIGGWVVGLPGLLGHGVVRVGWLTIGASTVLVVAVDRSRLRDARTPDNRTA